MDFLGLCFSNKINSIHVQMELWRKEFVRIEDDGDEEGFEEL